MEIFYPLYHAVGLKETFESTSKIFEALDYKNYEWNIYGYLKVVALLLGLQGGYTKYCCFLCLWDSRAKADHYVRRDWGKCEQFTPGEKNIKYTPLVDPEIIYLPPVT